MSDSKLHKLKGKTRRGVYGDDVPEEVDRYFDRKCGKNDGKVYRNEKKEKEWTKHSRKAGPLVEYGGMEEDYKLTEEDVEYEKERGLYL